MLIMTRRLAGILLVLCTAAPAAAAISPQEALLRTKPGVTLVIVEVASEVTLTCPGGREQTVTPAPMCRCTMPKLYRRFSSETWAQVGRVAVRFRISTVATAADYIGHSRASEVTPVLLPISRGIIWLSTREDKIHGHLSFHLHRFTVEHIGAVSPLSNGIGGGLHEHRVTAEHLEFFDRPFTANHGSQND